MFGFIKKFKNNSKIKKPRVKKARAKVAKVVDGHLYFTVQDFEPDKFEPFGFEPDQFEPKTITFNQDAVLAYQQEESRDEVIHDLEKCVKQVLN